ncbi:hypothetical protein DY000_02049179 [Brassica cretica]|uniref:Uncharacterized protein n=1 Tax=Brassica cretica TaxID=69181 RepID=A0ABQ7F4Z0_BRACR|nr:hypothetical protein DY000_02049179 [Brassica cretica]
MTFLQHKFFRETSYQRNIISKTLEAGRKLIRTGSKHDGIKARRENPKLDENPKFGIMEVFVKPDRKYLPPRKLPEGPKSGEWTEKLEVARCMGSDHGPDIGEEWWRPACVLDMQPAMWSTRCRRACVRSHAKRHTGCHQPEADWLVSPINTPTTPAHFFTSRPVQNNLKTSLTSGRSGGVLHVSWTCSQPCGARGAAAHASGAMRSDTRAATNLKLIGWWSFQGQLSIDFVSAPREVQIHGFRSVKVLLDTLPGSPKNCPEDRGGSVRVQISPSRSVSVYMIKPRFCPSLDQSTPVKLSIAFWPSLLRSTSCFSPRTLGFKETPYSLDRDDSDERGHVLWLSITRRYNVAVTRRTVGCRAVPTLSLKSGLGTGFGLVCIWFPLLEARSWQEAKSNLVTVCLGLAFIACRGVNFVTLAGSSLIRHVALLDHGVGLDGQSYSCLIVGRPVGSFISNPGCWTVDRSCSCLIFGWLIDLCLGQFGGVTRGVLGPRLGPGGDIGIRRFYDKSGDRGWNPEVAQEYMVFPLDPEIAFEAVLEPGGLDPEIAVWNPEEPGGSSLDPEIFDWKPEAIGEPRGTVLRLPRQDYYWYLFGFRIPPLGSWPLSSSYDVFYFCRKSLTGLEGAGVCVMTQVSGLRYFPRLEKQDLDCSLHFTVPRCAFGCTGVSGDGFQYGLCLLLDLVYGPVGTDLGIRQQSYGIPVLGGHRCEGGSWRHSGSVVAVESTRVLHCPWRSSSVYSLVRASYGKGLMPTAHPAVRSCTRPIRSSCSDGRFSRTVLDQMEAKSSESFKSLALERFREATVGFGFYSVEFNSGLTDGLRMTNKTGKASFSTVDSVIWSWVMLKLQSGRAQVDLRSVCSARSED